MRSAEDYLEQLHALLPPGDALTKELDTDLSNILLVLADEFARFDARSEQLLTEIDPRTTTELIAEWERVTGLPDCAPIGPTLGARRSDVVHRLTMIGVLTPAFLEAELLALGFTVVIREFEPFEVGFSEVGGDPIDDGPELMDQGGYFFFDAVTDAVAVFEAELGAFTVGEPLGAIVNDTMACLLDRLKPAHTNYRITPT